MALAPFVPLTWRSMAQLCVSLSILPCVCREGCHSPSPGPGGSAVSVPPSLQSQAAQRAAEHREAQEEQTGCGFSSGKRGRDVNTQSRELCSESLQERAVPACRDPDPQPAGHSPIQCPDFQNHRTPRAGRDPEHQCSCQQRSRVSQRGEIPPCSGQAVPVQFPGRCWTNLKDFSALGLYMVQSREKRLVWRQNVSFCTCLRGYQSVLGHPSLSQKHQYCTN